MMCCCGNFNINFSILINCFCCRYLTMMCYCRNFDSHRLLLVHYLFHFRNFQIFCMVHSEALDNDVVLIFQILHSSNTFNFRNIRISQSLFFKYLTLSDFFFHFRLVLLMQSVNETLFLPLQRITVTMPYRGLVQTYQSDSFEISLAGIKPQSSLAKFLQSWINAGQ